MHKKGKITMDEFELNHSSDSAETMNNAQFNASQ